MKTHLLKFLLLAILFISCDSSTSEIETTDDTNTDDIIDNTPTVSTKPNILLIIADDVSKDAIPNYTEGSTKANMNNLQSLMSTGITFDNVWSYAVCSPTRASIITGKYGLNTGVIQVGDQISTTETSLQQYVNSIDANDYATAIFGKWHISSNNEDSKTMGVDYFAGIRSGGVQDYYNWELIENGVNSTSTEYITSKLTDLAIDWKNEQTKPWFLWMGYNAPHTPFHLAPTNLHSQGNLPTDSGSIDANPLPYYISALEALDTEMGRLIESLSDEEKENTIIIFIGDNGTPGQVAQNPYGRRTVKNTLYQGGINVPMIISGVGVTRMGERETALINATDLYATIGSIVGSNNQSIHNSISFKDLFTNRDATSRSFVYSEKEDGFTIRNSVYKYIKYVDGSEEFFNLVNDPYEISNLENSTLSNEESAAKSLLIAESNNIRN